MSSFYQHLDKHVDEQVIDIVDFAKYHRHILDDQKDTISIRTIKELNNSRYSEFEQLYLAPLSQKGKIKCGDATLMWMVYEDMREVLSAYKNKDVLRRVDEKLALHWINEFKKDIKELWEYGPNVISSGYGIIIDYYRELMVSQKYEKIYSKGSSFFEYLKLARENLPILKGENMPFDIVSIREKADLIMKIRN